MLLAAIICDIRKWIILDTLCHAVFLKTSMARNTLANWWYF
ncbi:hypothetical protein DSOL_2725 [Desulfosporosinus metallidurans]|uniref:Uncharacterized protein n=1 Tax=Desulfosporosinus metallidurans TaxID=1888891 RepID=A0A1Q8QVQ3_9FIRM|nr:hypothetical protein DSOL_2725 [Desulfosporosinus metallidurans]